MILDGVREYQDGDPVELKRDPKSGRWVIVAYNECRNRTTEVDLFDLLDWLRSAELLSAGLDDIKAGRFESLDDILAGMKRGKGPQE